MLGHQHPIVEVEGFTGPFDLLLRLIERRQLDILTISLAAVTEQYLELLSQLRQRDPEHLTAFLVVAAKLLYIKSSLLLPGRPRTLAADELIPEDPADLAEKLTRYRAFREAALDLTGRLDQSLRTFARPPSSYQPVPGEPPRPLDPDILRKALLLVQERPRAEKSVEVSLTPRLSVADALDLVRHALERYASVALSDITRADPSRQRVVAVFLAVLELVRQGSVAVVQVDNFADIRLARREDQPAVFGQE